MVPDGLENRATRKGKGVRFSHLPPFLLPVRLTGRTAASEAVNLRSNRKQATNLLAAPALWCGSRT